jgi:hypothetical protein
MLLHPRRHARAVGRATSVVALAAVLAGCAGRTGGSPAPSGTAGAISHPTGGSDLILRVSVGGGFVAPGFLATEAPGFSLYGDGRIIFRDTAAPLPTSTDGIARGVPFQQVHLSEDRVQELLASALDTAGLRTAKTEYMLPVADAPTTSFTIDAAGVRKQVNVNGLGLVPDTSGGSDRTALLALSAFRDRLLAFGATATGAVAWTPERYRGSLFDATSGPRRPWPWTTFTPATFTNLSDTGSLPWPTRLMQKAEVAALGIDGLEGGAIAIVLRSPDAHGGLVALSLRPLLPDEPS